MWDFTCFSFCTEVSNRKKTQQKLGSARQKKAVQDFMHIRPSHEIVLYSWGFFSYVCIPKINPPKIHGPKNQIFCKKNPKYSLSLISHKMSTNGAISQPVKIDSALTLCKRKNTHFVHRQRGFYHCRVPINACPQNQTQKRKTRLLNPGKNYAHETPHLLLAIGLRHGATFRCMIN